MLFYDPLGSSIRAWLERPAPSILVVEGRREEELRRRIGAATMEENVPVRWLRPHPGGEPAWRLQLARDLDPATLRSPTGGDATGVGPNSRVEAPGWDEVWSRWYERAAELPDALWVVDAANGLPAAAWDALRSAWVRVRAQALGVRMLVAVSSASGHRLGDLPHEHLHLAPRGATGWLVGPSRWSAADRVRAAAVFGGDPSLVEAVDPSRSLGRNVRALVLAPGAPFATRALDRLTGAMQRPERYVRVVEAVATGAREWGEIRDRAGGLSSSGQLGPYLRALEDSGWVEGSRSMDASPRSRSTRYRVRDLHMAFWFSAVLPAWSRLGVDDPRRIWRNTVRPRLEAHTARVLPRLVEAWYRTERASELLGARAREAGALWGDGYDIAAAATLTTGAIVYGWTRWDGPGFAPTEVGNSSAEVRRTRYGFGREKPLRLLVQREPPGPALTRIAARDDALLVLGVDDLIDA